MAELTTRVENMEDVQNLSEQEKKSLVATTPDHLSIQDRKEVVQRFGVSGPAQDAADRLWRIIVTSCAIVLVGSFLAFAPVATGTDTVMLTVFTTAAGFLAGLLSLSPLSEGLTRESGPGSCLASRLRPIGHGFRLFRVGPARTTLCR